MNSCACISYRSKKRCLQACAYATAICVKLKKKLIKKIKKTNQVIRASLPLRLA